MAERANEILHVRADQTGQTLIAFLRAMLPGKSWGQVKNLVARRQIRVNGNLCRDGARRLKEKEVVHVLKDSAAPPPSKENLVLRFVDTHIVVVEKPAGITSNRHEEEKDWNKKRKSLQPTLDELLTRVVADRDAKRRPPSPKGKRPPVSPLFRHSPPRVRPVHRLDRDTSGIMVYARTAPAEKNLVQQFRQHTTERRYLAVVHGAPEAQTIESRLVRDRGDGYRGSTDLPDAGKLAITHVKPIERLGNYTLVECRLETGRTHQIRIHLSEKGFPVCGDKLYVQPLFRPKIKDASGAPRLALHSTELVFVHPISGETMRFEMGLPSDLAKFVARLRREVKSEEDSTPER
ncbi:MAG: RluA family pseudouridine synthase [Planctomycetota bacterium]